jgi:hypothetical protein
MKKYLYSLFIVALIIGCKVNEENFSTQRYQEITTKYTEIKEIISQEVDDTFYVYIRLPKNYVEENKRYPVLFCSMEIFHLIWRQALFVICNLVEMFPI